MPRSVLDSRLHFVGLMLVWAGWTFVTGVLLSPVLVEVQKAGRLGLTPVTVLGCSAAAVACAGWLLLNSRLSELAGRAHVWPARAIGLTGGVGVLGLVLGLAHRAIRGLDLSPSGGERPAMLLAHAAFGIVGLCLILLAPAGPVVRERFFLRSRHASDAVARRSLGAAAGHALLVVLACSVALRFPPEAAEPHLPRAFWHGALAYLVGIVLSLWQRYPQRAIAFIPLGWTIAALALIAVVIWSAADWPILLLGAALGIGHAGPRNDLLASLLPAQRLAGLALMGLAQAAGAFLGLILASSAGDAVDRLAVALAVPLAAVAIYDYFRELVELAVEPILAIANPITGYGPGLKTLPTRGPVLVLANHSAWFDPLWLAKLIPLRLRPMMTSKFYDLPVLAWLMRSVFHAIRVPDTPFRREAPEIAEAVAALQHGESILIFPEGWLRRREEQSLRRFGQGVYQILREVPRTPVIVCWIEGGWGSYVSYKGGPPTKNKKPDLFHRIRVGISEPQVLSIDMLHDHIQTRRHLMLACLHARTYLGLPELPPPPFAADDDGDESAAPAAGA